jgi:hypothetical protein
MEPGEPVEHGDAWEERDVDDAQADEAVGDVRRQLALLGAGDGSRTEWLRHGDTMPDAAMRDGC